jgi:hypothetical protein
MTSYSSCYILSSVPIGFSRDWWNPKKMPSLLKWCKFILAYVFPSSPTRKCLFPSNKCINHTLIISARRTLRIYNSTPRWDRNKGGWGLLYVLANVLGDQWALKDLMVVMSGHRSFILTVSRTWWGFVKSLHYSLKEKFPASWVDDIRFYLILYQECVDNYKVS